MARITGRVVEEGNYAMGAGFSLNGNFKLHNKNDITELGGNSKDFEMAAQYNSIFGGGFSVGDKSFGAVLGIGVAAFQASIGTESFVFATNFNDLGALENTFIDANDYAKKVNGSVMYNWEKAGESSLALMVKVTSANGEEKPFGAAIVLAKINKGEEIIYEYKDELHMVKNWANKFAKDTLHVYRFDWSSSTDYFSFEQYPLNNVDILHVHHLDITENDMVLVWNSSLDDITTRIGFIKDNFYIFHLYPYRDRKLRDARILYVQDKAKLQHIFQNWAFYNPNEKSKIDNEKEWVYFYDEKWAITIGESYFK